MRDVNAEERRIKRIIEAHPNPILQLTQMWREERAEVARLREELAELQRKETLREQWSKPWPR